MQFGQLFAGDPAQGGFGYQELTAYAAIENMTGFGVGANLGIYWEVSDMISLGLAYTSPTRLYLSGDASMDMTAQLNDAFGRAVQGVMQQDPNLSPEEAQMMVAQMFGGMGIDLSQGVVTEFGTADGDFDVPQKLAAGIGVRATPRLTFGLDVEWIDWSSAFDDFPLSFENGDNANINLMLNGDVADGGFNYDFPLAWKDSYNLKVGVDYQFLEKTNIRAGFIHGRNPVPDNTVFSIFPAIVEDHLTLGFGQRFGRFEFDFAYIRALNETQNAVSTGHLVGTEYNASSSQLSENLIMTSFMMAL